MNTMPAYASNAIMNPGQNQNLNKFGMASALSGLGSGIGSMFFGDQQDPYGQASQYFNQIPSTIKPYYDPYINHGRDALNTLDGQYNNLINDPTGMMNKIGAGYQQSPGYQFQVQQAQNAANNAAGAGGMLGTPANQYNSANMINGLANQDYYNYLNHGLNQYQSGLQGLGGLNQMGYNASNELANSLGNNLMNQGNLAFSGGAAQNQSSGQAAGNLFGGLAAFLPFLMN